MMLATRIKPAELAASYDFCREIARREAKNFYYSFQLLPEARRKSMCALYAYLRRTDDIADASGDVGDKTDALARWRDDLNQTLAGHPAAGWAGWVALGDIASRHAIPSAYLTDVIDGVAMDLDPRPFVTFGDLEAYCYRVASVVGLSCVHIWGFRSEGGEAERLAEACGVALQLTNIIRDVREDALNGRVYLPTEDLLRFGVDPRELAAPVASARVRALLEYEGWRAAERYKKARPLAPLVDPAGRPALLAIVGIYRRLLDEIIRRDYDVFTERVSLSPLRKTWITLFALRGWFSPSDRSAGPVESPSP